MEEVIAVVKGCFAPGPFSFEGEHYRITSYDGLPKPTQTPPPLLIGGGAPRVLSISASQADIVGINPSIHSGQVDTDSAQDGAAARTDQKLRRVRQAAADRSDDLEATLLPPDLICTDDSKRPATPMAPPYSLPPH